MSGVFGFGEGVAGQAEAGADLFSRYVTGPLAVRAEAARKANRISCEADFMWEQLNEPRAQTASSGKR